MLVGCVMSNKQDWLEAIIALGLSISGAWAILMGYGLVRLVQYVI
jgi:hypothetical protein